MDKNKFRAQWGEPTHLPHVLTEEDGAPLVIAYAVRDKDAAEAYAASEAKAYGNPARIELRESVGWCVIVDLRPQIERGKTA